MFNISLKSNRTNDKYKHNIHRIKKSIAQMKSIGLLRNLVDQQTDGALRSVEKINVSFQSFVLSKKL